ncbi:hypothetical protein N0V85_009530 [Neurospora sp. IMI 360204]|nr:hypothetical protein N0V85_009530 [Neurospora sp. IMI 360204]
MLDQGELGTIYRALGWKGPSKDGILRKDSMVEEDRISKQLDEMQRIRRRTMEWAAKGDEEREERNLGELEEEKEAESREERKLQRVEERLKRRKEAVKELKKASRQVEKAKKEMRQKRRGMTKRRKKSMEESDPMDYENDDESANMGKVRRGTRYCGPNLGSSYGHERASSDDDPLEDKPKLYRSPVFSDLIDFYESQSQETKMKNENVQHTASKSPLKRKTPQKAAVEVKENPTENLATSKRVYRRPDVQEVADTIISEPGIRQEPQIAAPETPERPPSLLVLKSKSSAFPPPPRKLQLQPSARGEATTSTSVDELPALTLKCRPQLPAKPKNNDHAANMANTKKKLSSPGQSKEEELSKNEKNDSQRPPPICRTGPATLKGTNTVPVHQESNMKPSTSKPDNERETLQIEKKEKHQLAAVLSGSRRGERS